MYICVLIATLLIMPSYGWNLNRSSSASHRARPLSYLKTTVAILGGASILTNPMPVFATGTSSTAVADAMVFKTGKNPVPNKDKEDRKGTKKDRKYLKCLSSCKAECELPTGGLATQRVDCVQDCRDQCCETYEQCSYKINLATQGM
jgi:hypothetical protein